VRVLITGAAGFLGSHLCDRFLAEGHEVVGMDSLITGSPDNVAHLMGREGFEFIKYDVTQFVYVAGRLDGVLHFASPASPVDYLEFPIQTLKVGSLGTHKTLGLAREKEARYLLASTSEIYGDPLEHPQTESYWGNVNPIGPRGVYDEAKRFADGRVVSNFLVQALLGEPLTVYGDGSQSRSFCYVSDLVEGLYRLFLSNENQPVNVGNPNEFTIQELADLILEVVDGDSEIRHLPLPEDDPKVRQPDITRARDILDWSPEVDLRQGLEMTADYFRALRDERRLPSPRVLAGDRGT